MPVVYGGSMLEVSPVMWRKRLRQASFKGAAFHVEHQGRVSGRRTVVHEYPKLDIGWAEDMGRHAVRYQVTGYVIQRWGSVRHGNMANDYDVARDLLIRALEDEGPGRLVDPYNNRIGPQLFQCERYSLTESRERGGYAQFEMAFVEAGISIFADIATDTAAVAVNAANDSNAAAAQLLDRTLALVNTPAGPRLI